MSQRHNPGGDVNAQADPSAYALLTDGTTIEIRPVRPDDFDAVRDMHAKCPRKICICASSA